MRVVPARQKRRLWHDGRRQVLARAEPSFELEPKNRDDDHLDIANRSRRRRRTMRGNAPLLGTVRGLRLSQQPSYICRQCRAIQISAAPSTEAPKGGGVGGDVFGSPIGGSRDMAGEDNQLGCFYAHVKEWLLMDWS